MVPSELTMYTFSSDPYTLLKYNIAMCVLHDGQLCKGHRQTQIYFIEIPVIFLKLFTIINSRNPFHNRKIILEVQIKDRA
jgi:hypothetical protein